MIADVTNNSSACIHARTHTQHTLEQQKNQKKITILLMDKGARIQYLNGFQIGVDNSSGGSKLDVIALVRIRLYWFVRIVYYCFRIIFSFTLKWLKLQFGCISSHELNTNYLYISNLWTIPIYFQPNWFVFCFVKQIDCAMMHDFPIKLQIFWPPRPVNWLINYEYQMNNNDNKRKKKQFSYYFHTRSVYTHVRRTL